MKNTEQYYEDLAFAESSNNPKIVSNLGFLGLYQMGEAALIDIGYYKWGNLDNTKYKNDWTGIWTGKNGIYTKEDFLSHDNVQNIAVKEYHSLVWNIYLKNYHQYQGYEINGVILTKSGIISCAHLVGHNYVKKYIDSNGILDKKDGNGVHCLEYLKRFSDYEIEFETNIKNYEEDIEYSVMNKLPEHFHTNENVFSELPPLYQV